jgi:hypothetical protein
VTHHSRNEASQSGAVSVNGAVAFRVIVWTLPSVGSNVSVEPIEPWALMTDGRAVRIPGAASSVLHVPSPWSVSVVMPESFGSSPGSPPVAFSRSSSVASVCSGPFSRWTCVVVIADPPPTDEPPVVLPLPC